MMAKKSSKTQNNPKNLLITRETDYAIRAMRALVGSEQKSLAAICEEEGVPQQFGYKILKKLAAAGYVRIKRGKFGGYALSEKFPKMTLLDLTLAVEHPENVSLCMNPGYICESPRGAQHAACKVSKKLAEIKRSLEAELSAINLRELLAE